MTVTLDARPAQPRVRRTRRALTLLAPAEVSAPLMVLTTQLLWFLGAYLLVTALTPLFVATTPARGAGVALALVVACGLVDAAREVKDKGTFGYLDHSLSTPDLNAFMQG